MSTIIKTRIVKIGNSQGIRIPKALLKQLGGGGEVELEVHDDHLILRSARRPRQDWDKAFEAMANAGDDTLLDAEALTLSAWDDEEWEWR